VTDTSTTKSPKPWRVYSGKLRPQFPVKVIEIHDADGNEVIKWPGFDGLNMSHTRKLAIARLIVKAVNNAN
jgi:hypothetical protein